MTSSIWMNWRTTWLQKRTTRRSRNWRKNCAGSTIGLRRYWNPIRMSLGDPRTDHEMHQRIDRMIA